MSAFSFLFLTPHLPSPPVTLLPTTSSLPPANQLWESCQGDDEHHAPTSGKLQALSLGVKHLELQSSFENTTNCLSDGMARKKHKLRLQKIKNHTNCTDFIRGWNPRKICFNNKQEIFAFYYTKDLIRWLQRVLLAKLWQYRCQRILKIRITSQYELHYILI